MTADPTIDRNLTGMTAIEPITLDIGPNSLFTATGLAAPIDEATAIAALIKLRRAGAAWRWIIGDLVLAIAAEHPDGLAHAWQTIADLDIDDPPSLHRSIAVAHLIPPASRRPTLSWSHHQAVLAGGPQTPVTTGDPRDRWLDQADQHGWTVTELGRRIAAAHQDTLDLDEDGPPVRPFRLPAAMTAAVAAAWQRGAAAVLWPDGTVTTITDGQQR